MNHDGVGTSLFRHKFTASYSSRPPPRLEPEKVVTGLRYLTVRVPSSKPSAAKMQP